MSDLATVPLGFVTTVLTVSLCTLVALRPPLPHDPRPFRMSFLLGHLVNEQPLLGLLLLAIGVTPTLTSGLGTPAWWLAAALSAIPVSGLAALAIRARSARPALESSLAASLGIRAPRTRLSPLRIVLPAVFWRPDVRRLRNRRYGSERHQRIDVYRPRGQAARAPVLLYLHGGGFQTGSKVLGGLPLLHHLAARGWVCASANYRLRTSYANSLADARQALAWIREHAEELGADPARVVVAGGSAGAHLATTIALTDGSLAAAIGLYGYYGPAGRPETGTPRSPYDCFSPDAPPTMIVHGALDTLVPLRAARRFADELDGVSKAPVVFVELPGTQHNFDFFHSLRCQAVVDGLHAFADWATGGRPAEEPATTDALRASR